MGNGVGRIAWKDKKKSIQNARLKPKKKTGSKNIRARLHGVQWGGWDSGGKSEMGGTATEPRVNPEQSRVDLTN